MQGFLHNGLLALSTVASTAGDEHAISGTKGGSVESAAGAVCAVRPEWCREPLSLRGRSMLLLSKREREKKKVPMVVWPHTATERYLRDSPVPLLLVSRLSSRALQPPTQSTHTTPLGHSQLLLLAPVYSAESTLNLVPLKTKNRLTPPNN